MIDHKRTLTTYHLLFQLNVQDEGFFPPLNQDTTMLCHHGLFLCNYGRTFPPMVQEEQDKY